MTRGTPDVSVVIPTYNAGPEFDEMFGRISGQATTFSYEVLLVDSGSSDGTLEVARKHKAKVLGIRKSEFNHGATRNRGIAEARGEFVAMTVQDALPADEHWLQNLAKNLAEDDGVAGAYSRQIPRPGCDPFTRHALENHFTNLPQRRVQTIGDPERYDALPPHQKLGLIVFDDVSSCVRRSVWEEYPFGRLSYGEDIEWSQRVLRAGYKIVYEPASAVVHSHDRSAAYELRRAYVTHKLLGGLIGMRVLPTFSDYLSRFPGLLRQRLKLAGLHGGGRLYARAVTRSLGDHTGVFLGGVAGAGGAIPAFLDRRLSGGV